MYDNSSTINGDRCGSCFCLLLNSSSSSTGRCAPAAAATRQNASSRGWLPVLASHVQQQRRGNCDAASQTARQWWTITPRLLLLRGAAAVFAFPPSDHNTMLQLLQQQRCLRWIAAGSTQVRHQAAAAPACGESRCSMPRRAGEAAAAAASSWVTAAPLAVKQLLRCPRSRRGGVPSAAANAWSPAATPLAVTALLPAAPQAAHAVASAADARRSTLSSPSLQQQQELPHKTPTAPAAAAAPLSTPAAAAPSGHVRAAASPAAFRGSSGLLIGAASASVPAVSVAAVPEAAAAAATSPASAVCRRFCTAAARAHVTFPAASSSAAARVGPATAVWGAAARSRNGAVFFGYETEPAVHACVGATAASSGSHNRSKSSAVLPAAGPTLLASASLHHPQTTAAAGPAPVAPRMLKKGPAAAAAGAAALAQHGCCPAFFLRGHCCSSTRGGTSLPARCRWLGEPFLCSYLLKGGQHYSATDTSSNSCSDLSLFGGLRLSQQPKSCLVRPSPPTGQQQQFQSETSQATLLPQQQQQNGHVEKGWPEQPLWVGKEPQKPWGEQQQQLPEPQQQQTPLTPPPQVTQRAPHRLQQKSFFLRRRGRRLRQTKLQREPPQCPALSAKQQQQRVPRHPCTEERQAAPLPLRDHLVLPGKQQQQKLGLVLQHQKPLRSEVLLCSWGAALVSGGSAAPWWGRRGGCRRRSCSAFDRPPERGLLQQTSSASAPAAGPSFAVESFCSCISRRCFFSRGAASDAFIIMCHLRSLSSTDVTPAAAAATKRLLVPRAAAAASLWTQAGATHAAPRQRRTSAGEKTVAAPPPVAAAVPRGDVACAGDPPPAFFLSDEDFSEDEEVEEEGTAGQPPPAPAAAGAPTGMAEPAAATVGGGGATGGSNALPQSRSRSRSSGVTAGSVGHVYGRGLPHEDAGAWYEASQDYSRDAVAAGVATPSHVAAGGRGGGSVAAAAAGRGAANCLTPPCTTAAGAVASYAVCSDATATAAAATVAAAAAAAENVTESETRVLPHHPSEAGAKLPLQAEEGGAGQAAADSCGAPGHNQPPDDSSTAAAAHVAAAVRSLGTTDMPQHAPGTRRRDSRGSGLAVSVAAAVAAEEEEEAACTWVCHSRKSVMWGQETDGRDTGDNDGYTRNSNGSSPRRRSSQVEGSSCASRSLFSQTASLRRRGFEENGETPTASEACEKLSPGSSTDGGTSNSDRTSSLSSSITCGPAATRSNNSSLSSSSRSNAAYSVPSDSGASRSGNPGETLASDAADSSSSSNSSRQRDQEKGQQLPSSSVRMDERSGGGKTVNAGCFFEHSGTPHRLSGDSGVAMAFSPMNYRALTMEMQQLEAAMAPRKEQGRALAHFLEQLQELLSSNLEACVVAAFGSAVNGLWTPYSDVDVCVQLSGAATRPLQIKALRQIAQALQPVQTYFVETRFQARVPIIHWAPRIRKNSSSGYKGLPKTVVTLQQQRQLAELQQQQHWRDCLQQAARRQESTEVQQQFKHSALSEHQYELQQQQWQAVQQHQQQRHALQGGQADELGESAAAKPHWKLQTDAADENGTDNSLASSPASLSYASTAASPVSEVSEQSRGRRCRQQQQQQGATPSAALSLRGNRGDREEQQQPSHRHMIACDISVNNLLAVVNSKLLGAYVNLDPRLRTLGYAVKWWARGRYINDRSRGTISSFSLILMLINFLQRHTFPPVLPSLQDLAIMHRVPPVYIAGVDCRYTADRDLVQQELAYLRGGEHVPPNTQSAGELLIQFFRYFGYEYKGGVIDIRDTSSFVYHNNRGCPGLAQKRVQSFAAAASLRDVYNAWNRAATTAAAEQAAAVPAGATGAPWEATWEEPIAGRGFRESAACPNFSAAGASGLATAAPTFLHRDVADARVVDAHYEDMATASHTDTDFLVVDNPFEIGKDVCNLLPCQQQRIRHEFKRAYSMLSDGVPLQQVAAPDFR